MKTRQNARFIIKGIMLILMVFPFINSTFLAGQMPDAIQISPESPTGLEEITLTFDPSKACVSSGKGSLVGAAQIGMHSSGVLDGESPGSWDHVINFDQTGVDGTPPVLTPNGDGTYSITFTPSDFYGTGVTEFKGITAVFNNGTNWDEEGKDFDNSSCKDFYIPFKIVNDPPVDITLTDSLLNEKLPAGTFVGKFLTSDPNPYDFHTYSFTAGSGDADNASFTISNDSLFSAEVFDYDVKNQYNIRIRSTDTGSLYIEKQFTISILTDTLSGTLYVSGDIIRDIVWAADTVFITDDILVPDGITLTIKGNTYIEFQGPYKIEVGGYLKAYGEEANKMTFTAKNHSEGWKGISFSNGAAEDTSILQNCTLEYVVDLDQLSPSGGAVNAYRYSNLIVADCEFMRNVQTNSGVLYCYKSDIIIERSVFAENSAYGLYLESSNATIRKCKITNHPNSGLRLINSDIMISNSIMANNGGNTMENSNILAVNNSFVNNNSGCRIERSNPEFRNCIFWNNSYYQVYIPDAVTSVKFLNCNIQNGLSGFAYGSGVIFNGIYEDNLEKDPLFVDPPDGSGVNYDGLNADWHLSAGSPCINTGKYDPGYEYPETDLGGNNRIAHGVIDIGPYEYHNNNLTVSGIISKDTAWIADTIFVTGDITVEDGATLTLSPGSYVEMQGYYKILVKGSIYALGKGTAMITFTINDTTYFADKNITNGGWKGFEFNSYDAGTDSSVLIYCVIKYVKKIGKFETGALDVNMYSSLLIDHCLISDNYGRYGGSAIALEVSSAVITNNEICYNESWGSYGGGAIYTHNPSTPLIENNNIHHNKGTLGGGINCQNEALIRNNKICYNTGGGIKVMYSEPEISGNMISNNEGGGLNIASNSEPVVINNIICNNNAYDAAAIYVYDDNDPVFINNTICNNLSLGSTGSAITTGDRCRSLFMNNIIWGNQNGSGNFRQIALSGENFSEFRNCIIQGGDKDIKSSWNFNGITENILDSLPCFVQPTSGSGSMYSGENAQWSIVSISPAIDFGSSGTTEFNIPAVDYYGNPRVNNSKIDVGAVENQSDKLQILKQPLNKIKCENEQASFAIGMNDTAYYQWYKDGTMIPGETLPVLIIDSITYSDQGNYTCLARNAYGDTESNPAYLLVNELPQFLQEPQSIWVEKDKTATFITYAKGTSLSWQWQKDGVDMSGEITPELEIETAGYSDEGRYRCITRNSCGADTTKDEHLYIAPQICMVTVSTLTGNNLIIWEKHSSAPLTDFNIYRESTAAGIYDLIGTVPYNNLSMFEDTTADPTKRAYIYKITGIDTSGTETDINLCKPHKTIHLLVTTNPELKSTQLAWDQYYGFVYQTYNIYRSTTGTNFTVIDAMPSSLNSWTDPEPITGELFYRVAVEKPTPCIPVGSGKKAESGPYSHSMSNIDDNRLQAGEYPPDTLILTNHYIDENNQIGELIGRFMTTDPDTNDAFTYTLVSGDGDDDNLHFTLLSDLLIAADYFDYETKNQYSIRVRSTDKTGNIIEGIFIIYINDLTEPTGLNFPASRQIMVYPNPMHNIATLVFPNPEGKKYTLIVLNLAGKVVRKIEDITTSRFILNKENLTKGYYLIELRGDKVYRGKIVVE